MAWNSSLDVAVGDATKETDYDDLVENVEYLQTLADVEHDFHVSTGTGAHKDITPDADSTRDIGETSTPKRFANVYTDAIGDSGAPLAIKSSSVRMENVPCVFAYNSASEANATGDGTLVTVDLDTEVFDQGGDFASDTFTAPVTGRYLMIASVAFDDLDAGAYIEAQVRITTSNRTYFNIFDPSVYDGNGRHIQTLSVIADMDAADTATVGAQVAGATKSVDIEGTTSPWTSFFVCMVA